MVSEEHHRLNRIDRAWKGAYSRRWGRLFHDSVGVAQLVGVLLTVILLLFDLALWGENSKAPIRALLFFDGISVCIALIAIGLLQGLCLEAALDAVAPAPPSLKDWLSRLRAVFVCWPLLGLCVFPIWYELLVRKPAWAFRADESAIFEQPRLRNNLLIDTRSLSWRVRLLFPWFDMIVLLLSFLAVVVWVEWLRTSPSWSWVGKWQLFLGLLIFHGAGFACMAYVIRGRSLSAPISTLRSSLLPLLPIAWLVPVPGLAWIGLFIWVFVASRDESRSSTLTEQAFGARKGMREPPGLYNLRAMLRSSWQETPAWQRLLRWPGGLDPPFQGATADSKIILLCRVKSVALFFEGAILALVSLWLFDRWPANTMILNFSLSFFLVASLLAGVGAVSIAGLRWLQRLSRSKTRSNYPPYAQSLAASQLSFFFGVLLGGGLHRGDARQIGNVLVLYAVLWVFWLSLPALVGIFLPVPDEENPQTLGNILWILGFSFMAILGLDLISKPESSVALSQLIEYFVWTMGLYSFAAGAALLPWLLRPDKITDIRSHQHSWGTRAALLFLSFTVLLPLGGLAAPGWLYLHYQKRRRYERQQAQVQS